MIPDVKVVVEIGIPDVSVDVRACRVAGLAAPSRRCSWFRFLRPFPV